MKSLLIVSIFIFLLTPIKSQTNDLVLIEQEYKLLNKLWDNTSTLMSRGDYEAACRNIKLYNSVLLTNFDAFKNKFNPPFAIPPFRNWAETKNSSRNLMKFCEELVW